jgi:hypothetical protein
VTNFTCQNCWHVLEPGVCRKAVEEEERRAVKKKAEERRQAGIAAQKAADKVAEHLGEFLVSLEKQITAHEAGEATVGN